MLDPGPPSTANHTYDIKAPEHLQHPDSALAGPPLRPLGCPTTHLANDPSAEHFRPVRVELKDSMVRSPRPVPQTPVSISTSTMENPKEEAASHSASIAATDRRSAVLFR